MPTIYPRSFFKDRNHGPFFSAAPVMFEAPKGWVQRTEKRPGDLVLTGGKFVEVK